MKTLLISILLLPFGLIAQNNPPQISNLQTTVNLTSQTINVTFDLLDVDADPMEVKVFLSADNGKTFVAHIVQTTGSVGSNITSGTGKSIEISYNNDSLYASADGNVQAQFAVRVVASDGHPIPISDIIAQVDSLSVYNDMLWIAQPRNYATAPLGVTAIKDSMESRFLQYNLQAERLPFIWANSPSENMTGRHPGLTTERNTVILDAHFDAVAGTSGADDNGTGICGVITAARILSQYHFNSTIKFIGFDKEEVGLRGAIDYVNNRIPSYENIEAVLNMEMMGYYSEALNSQTIPAGFDILFPATVDSVNASGYQGKWLFVAANANSVNLSALFNTTARSLIPMANTLVLNVPGNGQLAPDLRRSDHAPFWDAGYSALMLTDGAETRNFNYHTPGDSLGTINIPFLVRNIQSVIATAATLAEPIYADAEESSVGQLIAGVPFSAPEIDEMSIEVFPNPANHVIYLQFNQPVGKMQLVITDAQGRRVIRQELDLQGSNKHSIDLSHNHLSAGIYFLEVETEKLKFSRKFVVTEGHSH